MSNQRYTEKFKTETVKQITELDHRIAEVAQRLGVSQQSLYQWIKARRHPEQRHTHVSQSEELRRLRAELKRVNEERNTLKKGRSVLCQAVRAVRAVLDHRHHLHPHP